LIVTKENDARIINLRKKKRKPRLLIDNQNNLTLNNEILLWKSQILFVKENKIYRVDATDYSIVTVCVLPAKITVAKVMQHDPHICIGCYDGMVYIINFINRSTIFAFDNLHDEKINAIDITSDSKAILTASDDRSIKYFNLKKKKLLRSFKFDHIPTACAISRDKNRILGGFQNGFIWILNAFNWEIINIIEVEKQEAIKKVLPMPGFKNFVIENSSSVYFYELDSDKRTYMFPTRFNYRTLMGFFNKFNNVYFWEIGDKSQSFIKYYDLKTKTIVQDPQHYSNLENVILPLQLRPFKQKQKIVDNADIVTLTLDTKQTCYVFKIVNKYVINLTQIHGYYVMEVYEIIS